MTGRMYRTLVVIALCFVCMGVLVASDQSTLNTNETNRESLLKKNVLIYPVIMNGTVFRNGTSTNKNSVTTNITETPIQIDPLGDVLSMLKTSAIDNSDMIKKEEKTTYSDKSVSTTNRSSPSFAIADKVTAESEWVPRQALKSNIPLNNILLSSTESEPIPTKTLKLNTPSELVETSTESELKSTEPSKMNNSQDTTTSYIVQKSTSISPESTTSITSLSTLSASVTGHATHSTFQTEQTEAPETVTDNQETTASNAASSESTPITGMSTTNASATALATHSTFQTDQTESTETVTFSQETVVSIAVSSDTTSVSEAITEESTLSTFEVTASTSYSSSSEVIQSSQSTSDIPMTSPSGQEDSTSPPSKTELSTQSSTPIQSTIGILSSSDVPKDRTTPTEKEISTPTSETEDKTDVAASSPSTTPITDGTTSSPFDDTTVHITTIKKKSLTTLKLALSITFLVISLVAMAVLFAYILKMKKRTIPYEELSMEP